MRRLLLEATEMMWLTRRQLEIWNRNSIKQIHNGKNQANLPRIIVMGECKPAEIIQIENQSMEKETQKRRGRQF